MKKKFCLTLLVLGLFAAPLAAYEQGITLNGGVEVSIVARPFLYEEAAYKFASDEGFGFSVGLRVTEDLFFPSDVKFLYLCPYLQIDLSNYYLAGGVTVNSGTIGTDAPLPFIKTGVVFGDFDWGKGKGNVDIGVDFMTTMLWDIIDEGGWDAAVGSFVSIFNWCHLYVGVTWFLPF